MELSSVLSLLLFFYSLRYQSNKQIEITTWFQLVMIILIHNHCLELKRESFVCSVAQLVVEKTGRLTLTSFVRNSMMLKMLIKILDLKSLAT